MPNQDTRNESAMSKKKRKSHAPQLPKHLSHINKLAAGIDIGSRSHYVAVPEGCATEAVREFGSFTSDLYELSNWLESCGIETVAMESTGVYWIPLYELLESKGFEVKLVDARHVKNVSGRKTDVLDCQWLQQLHTYGLLNGAFRPTEQICQLRVYLRQRSTLIQDMSRHIQHMQKALSQMNLKLQQVLSDITGETGMQIIRAILAGQRTPKILAGYRDYRCHQSEEVIEKSLTGNYREEHLFSLKQAVECYDFYQSQLRACEAEIEKHLSTLDRGNFKDRVLAPRDKKGNSHCKNALHFDVRSHLFSITGVDLTVIPGIEASSALKLISEIGLDMSRWKNSKHFASWMGLCPGNKVSGGKRLGGKSKRSSNQAACILKMVASTLYQSKSALGAFFRRIRARLGAPKATTAAAHKLATIIYNMLKNKTEYKETGQQYYEEQYRQRMIKNLTLRAKELGLTLIATADPGLLETGL